MSSKSSFFPQRGKKSPAWPPFFSLWGLFCVVVLLLLLEDDDVNDDDGFFAALLATKDDDDDVNDDDFIRCEFVSLFLSIK